MPICSNCGKEIAEGVKFCPECGASATLNEDGYNTVRKQVFVGEVRKCPNCGSELQGMAAICPTCGYELNNKQLNSHVKKLADLLDDGEKKGYLTRERKTDLIENYPVPNEKESIAEFLYYIKMRVAALTNDKLTKDIVYWHDVWRLKAENIYQKASVVLGKDKMVENVYNEILSLVAETKKRYTKKRIIHIVITLAVLGGLGALIAWWLITFL